MPQKELGTSLPFADSGSLGGRYIHSDEFLRRTGTVYADGAYDARACHELIRRKGATVCIPPRNDAVLDMRKEGQLQWTKASGYHQHSLDGDVTVQAVDAGKAELAK